MLGKCCCHFLVLKKVSAAQLTELKALLGCVGETRFVMGCISQLQDGRYFLEDLSDALPIDLSEAQTTSGFFTGGTSVNDLCCESQCCCYAMSICESKRVFCQV